MLIPRKQLKDLGFIRLKKALYLKILENNINFNYNFLINLEILK